MNLPGLSEALAKLDATAEQMEAVIAGLDTIAELLTEQNALLRTFTGEPT